LNIGEVEKREVGGKHERGRDALPEDTYRGIAAAFAATKGRCGRVADILVVFFRRRGRKRRGKDRKEGKCSFPSEVRLVPFQTSMLYFSRLEPSKGGKREEEDLKRGKKRETFDIVHSHCFERRAALEAAAGEEKLLNVNDFG